MARPPLFHRHARVAAQTLIALVALGLGIAPPAAGRMLMLPLDGRPAAAGFMLAIAHHALPVAAGPVAGSVIVVGRRDALAAAALRHGFLILAAPPGGCGTARRA